MSDADDLPVSYTESKQEMAYNMKRRGMSLSEIAEELRCDTSLVVNMLKARYAYEARYLDDDERDGLLAMENARLDFYLSKLWPSVEYGDLKAIAEARKITEVRVKINNIDKLSSTNSTQVLVIGGEQANYLQKLKELSE